MYINPSMHISSLQLYKHRFVHTRVVDAILFVNYIYIYNTFYNVGYFIELCFCNLWQNTLASLRNQKDVYASLAWISNTHFFFNCVRVYGEVKAYEKSMTYMIHTFGSPCAFQLTCSVAPISRNQTIRFCCDSFHTCIYHHGVQGGRVSIVVVGSVWLVMVCTCKGRKEELREQSRVV